MYLFFGKIFVILHIIKINKYLKMKKIILIALLLSLNIIVNAQRKKIALVSIGVNKKFARMIMPILKKVPAIKAKKASWVLYGRMNALTAEKL